VPSSVSVSGNVKAYDAAREPVAIIPAVNRTIVTGRSRDDVDEALDSVIVKASALAAPAEAWARHGVADPLGEVLLRSPPGLNMFAVTSHVARRATRHAGRQVGLRDLCARRNRSLA
jgi:hypothetical protein